MRRCWTPTVARCTAKHAYRRVIKTRCCFAAQEIRPALTGRFLPRKIPMEAKHLNRLLRRSFAHSLISPATGSDAACDLVEAIARPLMSL